EFNSGVVGLAASRLADQYYRPAIVACRMEEYTRGSCRSIPGFHITDALDQCADLLERHGGHAAAAGFTVRNDRLDELVTRLQAIAQDKLGDVSQIRRVLEADLEIPLRDLHSNMFAQLERIQPTGYANREPVFVSRSLRIVQARQIGKENQHLRLRVTQDGTHNTYNAIAFRQGYRYAGLLKEKAIDLMYTFEQNEYNGYTEPQLNVRDIRPADPQ
ncbi:MAG TPA: DHHA1 domain-containing protein, partial [Anaerolineaceae bacterium]|nr:DHHA1 domain-containing protein [Anaerolineaceae bacterium]